MKTLAIMQPYFLPYIGYFQLIASVNKLVILDDVNFIQRGWINRNRLWLNNAPHMFTIPLHGASQNKLIYEIELADEQDWRKKLLSTIRHAYSKAPYYNHVSGLLENLINFPSNRLNEFLVNSLHEIIRYLCLEVELVSSSRIYQNTHLKKQARILDICRQEQTRIYINPIGGLDLYDKTSFSQQGISLYFLQSHPNVPGAQLSIIDVLMLNNPATIRQLLSEMDLI